VTQTPDYTQRVNATRHGILRLLPRVRALRSQLEPLDKAMLSLYNTKYDAERHLVKVKKLPSARGPKSKRRKPATKNIVDQVAEMTADEKADLIAKLEAEL